MVKSIDVAKELAALEKMAAKALQAKYAELFGETCRTGNRQWLFRRCAWRLQSLAEGGLSERALERAKALARDADIRVVPPAELTRPAVSRPADRTLPARKRPRDARLPMPGTRLKREYKGHVHEVEVLADGFAYDGERYKSLSAVAHVITGGHWNGYFFFGVQDPSQEAE
jgi:hypothetical protein